MFIEKSKSFDRSQHQKSSFFFAEFRHSLTYHISISNHLLLFVLQSIRKHRLVRISKSSNSKRFSTIHVREIDIVLSFCFVKEIDLFIIQKVRHFLSQSNVIAVKDSHQNSHQDFHSHDFLRLHFRLHFVVLSIFALRFSCLLHLFRSFQFQQ